MKNRILDTLHSTKLLLELGAPVKNSMFHCFSIFGWYGLNSFVSYVKSHPKNHYLSLLKDIKNTLHDKYYFSKLFRNHRNADHFLLHFFYFLLDLSGLHLSPLAASLQSVERTSNHHTVRRTLGHQGHDRGYNANLCVKSCNIKMKHEFKW